MKWEYMSVSFGNAYTTPDEIVAFLNKWGEYGWEFVMKELDVVYYFKRLKQET